MDTAISGLAGGHGTFVVIVVAFALGLRHASDPDHLVAVTTLVASTRERAARTAARLGAAWGAGHALTLLVLGLPVLLLRASLPSWVETAAEGAVGAVIMALAARLLVRWRRGAFHLHVHEHEGVEHAHVHSHVEGRGHAHPHRARTPLQAFGVGLIHGTAGTGGITVLVVASVPTMKLAVTALAVLVVGTAVAMTLLSAVAGRLLAGAPMRRHFARAAPALASVALVFGACYVAAALGAL
jgi:ABC-type nickel/cobalt efflux system permease component RcnA